MTPWQKIALVAVLGASYILGANVWFQNGWDQNDFKALTQQIIVALSLLFGPNVVQAVRKDKP